MHQNNKKSLLTTEPMFIFLILALMIFAYDSLTQTQETPASLVLTPSLTENILLAETAKKGSELSDVEKLRALNTYIDNELLFLDAMESKLHRDFTFYPLLVRKHQALVTSDVPLPNKDQAYLYYQDNVEEFSSVKAWDIQFFVSDQLAQANTSLLELESQTWHPASAETHYGISIEQARYLFSHEAASVLDTSPEQEWLGPFTTKGGELFMRITKVYPSIKRPFEDVEDYATNGLLRQKKEQLRSEYLEQLREHYGVHKVKTL